MITETGFTISYQSSADSLYLRSVLNPSPVELRRSGNRWILARPVDSHILNIPVRLESANLQFQGLNRFIGRYTASTLGLTLVVDFEHQRLPCQQVAEPYHNVLSGAAETIFCFIINLPRAAQTLRVTAAGGDGDVDILMIYHKPDFTIASSENQGNNESITLMSPEPGRWYLAIGSLERFSGVSLDISIDAPQAPVVSFSATPRTGVAPLTVHFTDASTGPIDEWLWDFGDGQTSTSRNPVHTFTQDGTFDVTLRVTGPGGTSSLRKVDTVRANPAITLMPILDLILDEPSVSP